MGGHLIGTLVAWRVLLLLLGLIVGILLTRVRRVMVFKEGRGGGRRVADVLEDHGEAFFLLEKSLSRCRELLSHRVSVHGCTVNDWVIFSRVLLHPALRFVSVRSMCRGVWKLENERAKKQNRNQTTRRKVNYFLELFLFSFPSSNHKKDPQKSKQIAFLFFLFFFRFLFWSLVGVLLFLSSLLFLLVTPSEDSLLTLQNTGTRPSRCPCCGLLC